MDEKGVPAVPLVQRTFQPPTVQVDVFAKDAILVPINLGNAHWTFACVNIRLKRIEYYDSLGGRRTIVYEVCVQDRVVGLLMSNYRVETT